MYMFTAPITPWLHPHGEGGGACCVLKHRSISMASPMDASGYPLNAMRSPLDSMRSPGSPCNGVYFVH